MAEQDALVWEGGRAVAVRPVRTPESRPGWVAVNVAHAGVSESDLHIAAGEHGRAQPGIVLGQEFVGHLAGSSRCTTRSRPSRPCAAVRA